MNLLTEIDGHKFNIGTLRRRLANIISEARDSELRVVAMTADDLIVALLAERTQAKQQLSLAEEGLANYAQENERLKAALQTICDRWRAPLPRLEHETDLEAAINERDDLYGLAADALRGVVPQPGEQT